MGLFGDPQDPETNALVIRMLQLPETSDILQNLENQQMKKQGMEQQAQQMQQMQMQLEQQKMFNPEAEQMKAQLDMEKQSQLMQMQSQIDMQKQSQKSDLTNNEYAAKQIADLSKNMITGDSDQQKAQPRMPAMAKSKKQVCQNKENLF